jgi:chromosome segregation ATPase
MPAYLEKLSESTRATAAANSAAWRQLVLDVCDGQEPPESDVFETLKRVGKTLDQLRATVDLVTNRRQLAAVVADAEAARGEVTVVENELLPVKAELDKAALRYDEAVAEIGGRLRVLDARVASGQPARMRLAQTATDPVMTEAIERCTVRCRELAPEVERFSELLRANKTELERLISMDGVFPPGENTVKDNTKPIAVMRALISERQPQLDSKEAELLKLRKEISDLESRKLVPDLIW